MKIYQIFEDIQPIKNPIVVDVFHGSGIKFTQFDQKLARLKNDFFGGGVGYFTDNKDIAKSYARAMSKVTKTPYLYYVTLKMNNVFDVNHEFTGPLLIKLISKDIESFSRGAGLLTPNVDKYTLAAKLQSGNISLTGDQVFKGLSKGMIDTASARSILIKNGFDGLRYNGGMNMQQATQHNVYIPYNNKSIKINKIEQLF